jgi:non-specific serine/threonine protein kinase
MTPTFLQIQLLGGFQLVYGRERLTGFDSPRLQSLLAYLLIHREAPQPRRQLAFLLYPDSAEAQARANLRSLLHVLRQALPAADQFLQSDSQTLQWRADAPFRLDVDEFEKAAAQANVSAALEQAVKLCQGELLPNCYDDWILPERERLHQEYLDTLERLVVLLANEGNERLGLTYAQLLLRQDPLREQSYAHLMHLYALSGDQAGVQRTYHTCQDVLQRELGAEPSAATRTAYDAALNASRKAHGARSSPPRRNNNLPLQLTSFIGREREIARIKALLAETRLLTLTGTGGSGKTRLALQVAGELAPTMTDGVWLVEFAPLSDPALVPLAVAKVLDVREEPGRPLTETLAEALKGKQLLLVLDNCDHLVTACAQLAEVLLHQRQQLRLVATSRERLNLRGEVVWHVPTLSLPRDWDRTTLDGLMASEAIRLFVERAAAALPSFTLSVENMAVVAEICARLDGMPLAIELAAARVRALSVGQIAARLDDAFRLLTRGSQDAPARHQTLRATMDWSYALLSETERILFRRLAVFAGSFSLDAAESVASDNEKKDTADATDLDPSDVLDLLSSLVDKSLITLLDVQLAGQARYRLLEPIRQYAREKLAEAAEEEALRARHLTFFLRLAEDAGPRMEGAEQAAWLDRMEAELDNVRAAFDWALQYGDTQAALQIIGILRRLWFIRPYEGEGIERLQAILARPDAAAPTRARLTALNTYIMLLWTQGDLTDVQPILDEAIALAGALEDRWNKAFVLLWAGHSASSRGEYEAARSYLEQSLALWQALGDKLYPWWTLTFLGDVALFQGDMDRAGSLFEASIEPLREAGDNPFLAVPLRRLGQLAMSRGDLAGARAFIKESLHSNWNVRDYRGAAACLAALAAMSMAQGEPGQAASLFGCAASFLEFIRTQLLLYDQQQYEHNLTALRAQMDAAAFDRAWARGRALTREQAVDHALATAEPDTT